MTSSDPYEPTNTFILASREHVGAAYQVRTVWRGTQPGPKLFVGDAQARHYADYINGMAHEMYPQGDAQGVHDPVVVEPVDLAEDIAFVIYEAHSGAIVGQARTREEAEEELEEVRLFNPPRAEPTGTEHA